METLQSWDSRIIRTPIRHPEFRKPPYGRFLKKNSFWVRYPKKIEEGVVDDQFLFSG